MIIIPITFSIGITIIIFVTTITITMSIVTIGLMIPRFMSLLFLLQNVLISTHATHTNQMTRNQVKNHAGYSWTYGVDSCEVTYFITTRPFPTPQTWHPWGLHHWHWPAKAPKCFGRRLSPQGVPIGCGWLDGDAGFTWFHHEPHNFPY